MRTNEEIKEWFRSHKTGAGLIKIFAFLEGAGIDPIEVAELNRHNAKEASFYDFKEWFNEVSKEEPLKVFPPPFCPIPNPFDKKIIEVINEDGTHDELLEDCLNRSHIVKEPKFKVGDKVYRKKSESKKPFIITKVVYKKGKPRYNANALDHSSFMCQVRESKIERLIKPNPQLKAGDWVRHKWTNICFEVHDIKAMQINSFTQPYLVYYGENGFIENAAEYKLEPYKPKEGEFAFARSSAGSAVFIAKEGFEKTTFKYLFDIKSNTVYRDYFKCADSAIWELRPASDVEKLQLISAVQRDCGLTWDETTKSWVDVGLSIDDILRIIDNSPKDNLGCKKVHISYIDGTELMALAESVNIDCNTPLSAEIVCRDGFIIPLLEGKITKFEILN